MLASSQAPASDCTPLGQVDAKVVTSPDHGTIAGYRGVPDQLVGQGDRERASGRGREAEQQGLQCVPFPPIGGSYDFINQAE
jgi:hypothetical protein